nr:SMC family ATPase [Brachybacterium sacelli]
MRLTGIGPFAGTVDIDLAALGASGMFLLEGPTGSGKSTILDAIVYALYGHVAGSATSGDRIRSQFAPPTAASVVDLVFETGSGIYRVRRQPPFDRAKKRGTGTTPEQAKAVLWRIGSPQLIPAVVADTAGGGADVEALATRIDEVGREIQRAVGLTREQFTQTVLLPQNEFARFLRAGTGERQQVLQRVFGTEIYADVEKQLEEMRKAAKRQVDAATETLGRALARYLEAAGVGEERAAALQESAAALRLEPLATLADEHLAGATARATAATEHAETAASAEQRARTAADEARAARKRLDRRRDLDTLAARLEQERPTVQSARTALRRDETARPVAALLQRRDTASTKAGDAIERLAQRASTTRTDHPALVDLLRAAAAGTEHEESASTADDADDATMAAAAADDDDAAAPAADEAARHLTEAADAATSAAGALADLVALEDALPRREQELTDRRESLAAAVRALEALVQRAAERPATREKLVEDRERRRTAAAALGDARLALRTAEEQHGAATAAVAQRKAVETAKAQAARALAAAQELATAEAGLRHRRFAGIAAELAVDLTSGKACPVCGALEHPHPADPAEDSVTPDQVEAAETRRKTAETEQTRADQAHALAAQELTRLQEAAGERTPEDAQQAVTAAKDRVAAARDAETKAGELDASITRHDEETARLATRREQEALAVERERTAISELEKTLEADRTKIIEAREDDESIAARRRGHLDTARAATGLREALRERTEAEQQAAELAAEAEEALAASGLATDDQARAAVLEDPERRRLSGLVETRAVEESRLADGLAEEGITETTATDEARQEAEAALAATTEKLTAAQSASREAAGIAARLEAVAERGAEARTALAAASAQVETVSEEAGVVVRVADLATGRSADGDRVQLSTYVLMWRLDAVVQAANARLALFSGSDLELLRDTGSRGARKTGLDLLVMDRRTDQVRVPETLSGGETFFVSLALALGLADIVTGEAGGVRMETLFIDEGFGSLDPETLETVVREIGRLAEHGRTIGIVSHVGDMKAQIAEQIHVRRGADDRSSVTITA